MFFQYVLFVMGYLANPLSCNIYKSYFNIETIIVIHLKSLGMILSMNFKLSASVYTAYLRPWNLNICARSGLLGPSESMSSAREIG